MLLQPKTLKTGKLARRKRTLFLFKIAGLLFFIGALFVGIIYAFNRPELLISNVIVSGTSSLGAPELKQFVEDKIAGKYVYLIPRANVLLYPKQMLEKELLSKFKPIREVTINRGVWGTLLVSIDEREPNALWCGENRLEGVIPECYFLDEDGFIYMKAPVFSENVYMRFYGPLENGYPLGQFFLEPSIYGSLGLFVISLKDEGIPVADFSVRDDHDFEVHLGSGIQVLFARNQELSTVLNNMRSVFASDEFKNTNLSTVDYIDLRFGNKVFYKLLE